MRTKTVPKLVHSDVQRHSCGTGCRRILFAENKAQNAFMSTSLYSLLSLTSASEIRPFRPTTVRIITLYNNK